MIAAGVLLLLFVTYQLWGTGLRTDSSQSRLGSEFNAQQAEVSRTSTSTSTTSTTAVGASTPPVSATPSAAQPAEGTFPPPKPGQPIGQIKIPKIGADFYMVEGVDLNYLAEGPGHFPGTPFPGQAGNAALAGHRTTWKAPFNRIDELVPGDTIQVTTLQGTFTYEVTPQAGSTPQNPVGNVIISPNQTEILKQEPGQNTLTLMACHPKYSAAQRIVVVGKLVDQPAATTEKSAESKAAKQTVDLNALQGGSGGDLVGGSTDARNPALLWGLLAAAVWLAAWLIARHWPSWRRWQKWAVYVVALPIFLVPLFFAFENINRLLPAGY